MTTSLRLTGYALGMLLAVTVLGGGIIAWKWQDRPGLAELDWPIAESESSDGAAVTVTWLGISTLLFDDGETQILTDGTITRVPLAGLLTMRPLVSDIGQINFAMERFGMHRLAAVIPTHSHFDHAMDAGHIANRSAAVVLGSESTANIARGAGVPVDQYQILANGETRHFGEFTITLIEVRHAPIGPGEDGWFSGVISEPLEQPARFFEWKSGAVYSVIVSHPRGTSIVHSSAGFIEGALHEHKADVILLGVGGLSRL
ncbi:MAG: MBL fold metallo-hydrolase, partial [Gammaproteobacteria bacterium]|nr:MBL fold metallo-hydrolase [Gammaproteobacteria bacterium]